ncbi:hypothetical protein J6590_077838 [Homalodisca vitripennis]|nr:hypothetical protein J6590_077838 [Homalodisca vitripennis]
MLTPALGRLVTCRISQNKGKDLSNLIGKINTNIEDVKGQVHQYGTRGRDNFRTSQYRLMLSQHLPQQIGVRLINKLPESVKNSINQNQLKTRLKCLLVSKTFYSVDEFMTSRWEV